MTASSGEEGEAVDPATALVTDGSTQASINRSQHLDNIAANLPTQD